MQLRIKLRDGFRDDGVRISVGGREVYRKSGVTTDLPTSLADIIEVPTDADRATLEVEIEGRGRHRQEVHVATTPFVDVWANDDTVRLLASAEETPIM